MATPIKKSGSMSTALIGKFVLWLDGTEKTWWTDGTRPEFKPPCYPGGDPCPARIETVWVKDGELKCMAALCGPGPDAGTMREFFVSCVRIVQKGTP